MPDITIRALSPRDEYLLRSALGYGIADPPPFEEALLRRLAREGYVRYSALATRWLLTEQGRAEAEARYHNWRRLLEAHEAAVAQQDTPPPAGAED